MEYISLLITQQRHHAAGVGPGDGAGAPHPGRPHPRGAGGGGDGGRAARCLGFWDNTLRVWDLATGRALAAFSTDGALDCCTFAPDGYHIIAGNGAGQIHFLRLEEPSAVGPGPAALLPG